MIGMARNVKVALLQMRAAGDPPANLRRALDLVRQAADGGAQIICTQELFRTLYFCQREDHSFFDLSETIPGPTTAALAETAKSRGVVIVASIFERRAQGVYHNTAVVIDADGRIAGKYRKTHIPDDPLYYEKFYFTPGDLGFGSFPTRFGRVGVLICWDQWFPEAARLTAMSGAEILFYPTAIGWHPAEKSEWGQRQYESWLTIQRGHAIANGIFVCVPNRVGREVLEGEGIEFWGQSFIADPSGTVLARGSVADEEIVAAVCDLDAVELARTHWPFLRDRRIDIYGDLLKRYAD
jgi:N-carbamoylputrescine amidase